jgi:hypothetical protein
MGLLPIGSGSSITTAAGMTVDVTGARKGSQHLLMSRTFVPAVEFPALTVSPWTYPTSSLIWSDDLSRRRRAEPHVRRPRLPSRLQGRMR